MKLSQHEILMVGNPKCLAKENQSKGKCRFHVVSVRDLITSLTTLIMSCLLNFKFLYFLWRKRENWHCPREWNYLSGPLKYLWTKIHLPFCEAEGENGWAPLLPCDRCTGQHLRILWLGWSRFCQSLRPHCSSSRSRWCRLLQGYRRWGPPFLQGHQDTNPTLQHKLESTEHTVSSINSGAVLLEVLGYLHCWSTTSQQQVLLAERISGYWAPLGLKVVEERNRVSEMPSTH